MFQGALISLRSGFVLCSFFIPLCEIGGPLYRIPGQWTPASLLADLLGSVTASLNSNSARLSECKILIPNRGVIEENLEKDVNNIYIWKTVHTQRLML